MCTGVVWEGHLDARAGAEHMLSGRVAPGVYGSSTGRPSGRLLDGGEGYNHAIACYNHAITIYNHAITML